MATMVKQYKEHAPKRVPGANKNTYPLPNNQLAGEVADHHHLQGGGSPKSVIRDHAPSGNSNYYYSFSSSSSAERASSANLWQQGPSPVDTHNGGYNRLKLTTPHHHHYKESSALEQMIESSAATTMKATLDRSNTHFDNSRNGPQSSNIFDIHQGFVSTNKVNAQQSFAHQQQNLATTQSCTTSKPYECYVPTEIDNVDDSKLWQDQGTPLNSLINTLMQQYQPSFVVEDGKPLRHPCLNKVLADVCNVGFNNDSAKPKFITSKWDEGEKWTHTKLSSTHSTFDGSTHNVPLFKLSHNEHTFPVMSVAQAEGFSLQPSHNKVHLSSFEFQPCNIKTDRSMWDKDILKEVEKLTDAVSSAQACLERIQPIPPPRNTASTAINPFVAQGVFRNRMDPKMVQSTLKHNAQVDPVMTKSAIGSSHVPIMGASNIELFWSPIKADKLHPPSNGSHLTASQAPQKEIYWPPGTHSGLLTPTIKDTEIRGDFTKVGEHFHVQKPEKSDQGRMSTTSYMKDAFTEITPTTSHRDMGTQMTPIGSSRPSSRPHSPQRGTALSPARHNTPTRLPTPTSKGTIHMSRMNPLEVERCRRAKFQFQGLSVQDQVQHSLGKSFECKWSSREEEEEDSGKGLRHIDLEDLKLDVIEARASARKESTRLKLLAKYEREETKIQAWEDLQAAKAEADLKKLEMKLAKKKMQTTAKIASKLDAAHKRAEERRALARSYKLGAMEKATDHAREEAMRSTYPLYTYFTCSFG
eukprot:c15748_g1_i1 orf=115-2373(-)